MDANQEILPLIAILDPLDKSRLSYVELNDRAERCLVAMNPQTDDSRRASREGHGAIFLVGVLLTALLVGAALIAIGDGPVFNATTPADMPLSSEKPR